MMHRYIFEDRLAQIDLQPDGSRVHTGNSDLTCVETFRMSRILPVLGFVSQISFPVNESETRTVADR